MEKFSKVFKVFKLENKINQKIKHNKNAREDTKDGGQENEMYQANLESKNCDEQIIYVNFCLSFCCVFFCSPRANHC